MLASSLLDAVHDFGPRCNCAGVLDIGLVAGGLGFGQERGHGLGAGQLFGRVKRCQHFTASSLRHLAKCNQ